MVRVCVVDMIFKRIRWLEPVTLVMLVTVRVVVVGHGCDQPDAKRPPEFQRQQNVNDTDTSDVIVDNDAGFIVSPLR